MQVRELIVPGAFEFTPTQHGDDRGLFLEWFKVDKLQEAIGHPLTLAQANLSVSRAGLAARRALRGRPAGPGQVRHLPARRGARLHRRHQGRLAHLRRGRTSSGWTPSTVARSTCRRASATRSWRWRTTRR